MTFVQQSTDALSPELEAVLSRAAAAAPVIASLAPELRARALVGIADGLDDGAEALVAIARRETGLSTARLSAEVTRTAVQLRLFADTLMAGAYLDARIDEADPAFILGPRPDLRRTHVPVGPVINFSASNFPFAFSVMGGDSAAILAAGCPLIVKAHSGHPETSDATAAIAARAIADAGLPDGTFQLIHGREAGIQVLQDPRVRAGAFTGSIRVGRLLADLAASRPTPIPFYGELGSVNPVFITAEAIAERADSIAEGFLLSVAGSAGQLCTKPGFVFTPEGSDLPRAIREFPTEFTEHRLLDRRIAASFGERREAVLSAPGVTPILEGSLRFDEDGFGWATPTIVSVPLAGLRAGGPALLEESFGPLSIVVEVPNDTAYATLVPELFAGNLSGTLHVGVAEAQGVTDNTAELQHLVTALTGQVGRVLFNGWPTGVAVTPAQQHGGPWPATTNDTSTSVGTAAISRFQRPVAFQNVPDAFLPAELRDTNPAGAPQSHAHAGASTGWGARWRADDTKNER